jgi:hypothetical protein
VRVVLELGVGLEGEGTAGAVFVVAEGDVDDEDLVFSEDVVVVSGGDVLKGDDRGVQAERPQRGQFCVGLDGPSSELVVDVALIVEGDEGEAARGAETTRLPAWLVDLEGLLEV